MKTTQELYNERLERLNKTLALEKTDRPPVILQMDGFCAIHMGYTLAELCKGVKESNKIMFETDGTTDIYKIKEVIGSNACIKGDVPAGKLVLGTPDEVYNYSTQLIKDMGNGFILSSGCSIPPNAKVENVKAMISAATGK